MNGTVAVPAHPDVRNPEKLPADDLAVLASVVFAADGVTHEPFGKPGGPGLWHHKGMQLPAYMQQVAHDIMDGGTPESRAIATAVSRCKVWCATSKDPAVKAKACAAVAEWEALKSAHAAWNPSLHPRVPAGGPGGGEFGPGGKGPAPTNAAPVQNGQSGPQVKSLQERLNALGYGPLKVDGQFGPKTEAAVRKFQSSHTDVHGKPLKVDGLIGPLTTSALRMKTPQKITPGKTSVKKTRTSPHNTTVRKTAPKTRVSKPGTAAPKAPTVHKAPAVHKTTVTHKTAPKKHGTPKVTVKPKTPAQKHQAHLKHLAHLRHLAYLKAHPHGAAGVTLPDLVTMPGVELLAAGSWELSSGRNTFTRADIQSAIDSVKCPAIGDAGIKLGHIDPRFDGEPAIGKVVNLRANDAGDKLIGDLTDMPGWLGAIAHAAFPKRSIEGSYGVRCQIGHDHSFVLTGLALLGITPPGVAVLNGLPDIASLYGIQAAAVEREVVTAPLELEGDVVAITEEDVRRAYYAHSGAPSDWWITELQMSPTQLVVSAGDGTIYRVPFTIEADDGEIIFEAAESLASYADLAASRGTGRAITYASAAESRSVEDEYEDETEDDAETEDDVEAAANNGWVLRDGEWEYDPDGDGDNDGTASGDTDNSHWDADGKMKPGVQIPPKPAKASADTPPTMNGDKETGPASNAMINHGPVEGSHSHEHPAYGAQGNDKNHSHKHTHSGDAVHEHAHATAGAGNEEGVRDMEFSDEQITSLRASLGLGEDGELDAAKVVAAAADLKSQKVRAGSKVPQGVVQISEEVWDATLRKVEASERFVAKVKRSERDDVIDAAIRAGKFTAASRGNWVKMWDADPDSTRDTLASLKRNVVPVEDIGSGEGDFEDASAFEAEFAGLYPPGTFKDGR